MKILGNRILAVEYEEDSSEPTQTDAGIYIPPTAQDDDTEQNAYVAMGVGSDVEEEDIQEGTLIFVGSRTAAGVDSIPFKGTEVKIFTEKQIILIDNEDDS